MPKIGIFDSGHGGTTVMSAVKKLLPTAEYLYIADTAHRPYGEKPDSELYPIVSANVEKLKSWGADVIVIACNTATVRCIAKLRRDYPELQFIGTEPAIKVAADSGAKNILVLATPSTIASKRAHEIAEGNRRPGQQIDFLPCPGLADTIERNYKDGSVQDSDGEIVSLLNATLPPKHDYDAVVLGCTHYPLIKEYIQRYFPNAQMVDGSLGVARRVKSLLDNTTTPKTPTAKSYSSL